MNISVKTILLAVSLSLSSATIYAADNPKSQGNELNTTTCGGIIDLFISADPEITKNKKQLSANQDQVYNFVMWVNGYLNGKNGIDFQRFPLNQEGVTKIVGNIYNACKDNEKKLFLDAVKDIK